MTEKNIKFMHFLGLGGSGKDTQGAIVKEHTPNSVIISTGDIVRGCKDEASPYHRYYERLKPFLEGSANGGLIPDDVMIEVAKEETDIQLELGATTIIYTGFPRTPEQREKMDAMTKEYAKDGVNVESKYVFLDIPEDTSRERAKIRREKAEADGQPIRKDDKPEVVERRIEEFRANTRPMLDGMTDGRVRRVEGVGTINEVARWTLEALDITPSDELIVRAIK